ncbi:hypothetical protein [Bacillus mycoides]|uniref:hypothetical protein n=1 Tax=Bacillus mycoides TaxID=1405 RepID=UPI000DCFB269|nr:hypothetical protein [Bacillus mycoides]
MEKQQQLIIDIKVEVPCLDPNGKGSFLCGRFFDARVWALELDNIKAEATRLEHEDVGTLSYKVLFAS